MKSKPQVEHRVIIRIKHACDSKPMTEKQCKKWVEKHFVGCDYGEVRVTDVLNEEYPTAKDHH